MRISGPSSQVVVATVGLIFLGVVFTVNSLANSRHEDYRNSNFAKFWVAGHMILTGQNPYDPAQWQAEQRRLGSTWTPDPIFLYPLPQAFLIVPLALLPPRQSFIVWGIVSQFMIAASCLTLLRRRNSVEQMRLFVPLVLFLLFFGPVYLSLQIGSISAIALVIVVAGIVLLDTQRLFAAGVVLSLLMLKPPQGLPILLLLLPWLVFKGKSRAVTAVTGILIGGLILIVAGALYDPSWMGKFLENSLVVSNRALGTQSTVWSLSALLCGQNATCTVISGAFAFALVLAFSIWVNWRFRQLDGAWAAFATIIPLAFASAIYLFAYDQMLFVIPITWAAAKLVERTRSYAPTFVYLLILDVLTLALLAVQATIQTDSWSLVTTLLVLGLCLILLESDRRQLLQNEPAP